MCCMHNEGSSVLRQLLMELQRDWQRGQIRAYQHFLLGAVGLVEAGAVSEQNAARAIASTMFLPGIDRDPLREEITIVAGDLETGNPCSPIHTWKYLRTLVEELARP